MKRILPGPKARPPSPNRPTGTRRVAAVSVPATASAPPVSAWLYPALIVAAFFVGLLVGYGTWGVRSAGPIAPLATQPPVTAAAPAEDGAPGAAGDLQILRDQINPPDGYRLDVSYGDLGPKLLAAGVIDYQAFAALYDQAGQPLNPTQLQALMDGSDEQVVISRENAYFLLNFFWAVGLANRNPILSDGAMRQYADGNIERFASTGGWSIASKPITDLYASLDLIGLTPEQQQRLAQVASGVYRPCCGNPTSFPDCNHGMAMLGLLELMASQDATPDEMFTAAKYVNAYWFPDQALESALYLKTMRGIDFASADARLLTGADFASGSGFAAIHQQLQTEGLLPSDQGGSGSCTN